MVDIKRLCRGPGQVWPLPPGHCHRCPRPRRPWPRQRVDDPAEIKPGDPLKEVVESDTSINYIYLGEKIPPCHTRHLNSWDRKLSVVCDVSADSTNPLTPGKPDVSPWTAPGTRANEIRSVDLHLDDNLRQTYGRRRRV